METATKAGRYEILGELGRGGMGVVYRAKDPLIDRTVATKTIRLSEEGTGMSHAQLVERFQTEARAAGLLTHPNIVVIYDVGECDGLYYITMELVNGKSLQALMDAGEKFPLMRLLRIMEQVCSALQFAHENGVVHRDIKPANIMLTKDDFVKITDFGTAKILQCGAAQQTSAMGTPAYMSPEQIKGKAIDGRSDIFALGVMLYEMTTGVKPFRGQDIATILYHILNEEPLPPNKVDPSIPLGVSSTIMKALAKNPHARFENCRDLLDDLKHFRPGEAAPPRDEPRAKPAAPRPAIRESAEKNFQAQMPRIPGVESRPAAPEPPRARLIPPPSNAARRQAPVAAEPQIAGVYTGPPAKKTNPATLKRIGIIAGGILLGVMVGSFAIKMIGRQEESDSEASPTQEDSAAPAPAVPVTAAAPKRTESPASPAVTVSASNPDVATVSELGKPWSSKRFTFRSGASKYVSALIIRLPGPASESKSYWAFSLEAPFSRCEFTYLDDLGKLSSEYGVKAAHPMVVNPCSQSVFDPLQMKELAGNVLVRGAIIKGFDLRPPYGIEVKVSGEQIQALAMEE